MIIFISPLPVSSFLRQFQHNEMLSSNSTVRQPNVRSIKPLPLTTPTLQARLCCPIVLMSSLGREGERERREEELTWGDRVDNNEYFPRVGEERERRERQSEWRYSSNFESKGEGEWLWVWFIISNSTFVSQFNVNTYNIFKHYSALMPNSLWIIITTFPLLLLLHQ